MALKLYIDIAAKKFVIGPNSSIPAALPDFVQGDQIPIELYFLEPTGEVFSPYKFKSYTSPAIRFGIGRIAGPTAGTFKITDGVQTTAAIAFDASASAVQTAIRAALTTNWSAAVVTGSAGNYVIDRGTTGNVAQLTATTDNLSPDSTSIISTVRNGTGSVNEVQQIVLQQLAAAYQATWSAAGSAGSVTPSTVQAGDPSATAPKNEIQRLTFSTNPLGGTFTLTFTEGTTAAINYNATADQIATAINALLGADAVSIENYVVASAGGITAFDIKWADNKNQAQVTVGASNLQWSLGFSATVSLDTLGVDQMLGSAASVTDAIIEIEVTPSGGTPETLIHQTCTVTNDLLPSSVYGSTPNPRTDGFQYKSGTFNFSNKDRIAADTTSSAFTGTLPASPTVGDVVEVVDAQGTWGTNNLTIGRNSQLIDGNAGNLICNVAGAAITLVFVGGAKGWAVYDR